MKDHSATTSPHGPAKSENVTPACRRWNNAGQKNQTAKCRLALLSWIFPFLFAAVQLPAETTIYVGKHFEVRDHDAPVKYVVNGRTKVARITGSLSANQRIQRLRLRAGWNLVSLAVTAADFPGQLREFTGGPAPVIQTLYRWQPATKDYRTIASGETVAAQTVLWISARTNAFVAVRGEFVEPNQWGIPAGDTFAATPGLEAQPLRLPAGATVWRHDPRSGRWQIGLGGSLASVNDLPPTLAPGEAIYIHSDEPTDLGAPARQERIRYYHPDHLGSSSVMTDADGTLIEETAFYPFGAPRHAHRVRPIEEPYAFTQKERDHESGLHYFEARYLQATQARFASLDPKYANPEALGEAGASEFLAHPQKMNLYAYARNNPICYVDPTGLDDEDWGLWDLVQAGSAEVARATREDPRERAFTSFFVGASDSLSWGMGGNYPTMRGIVVEGLNVDTDSGTYYGGRVAGFLVGVFVPGGILGQSARAGVVGGEATMTGIVRAGAARTASEPVLGGGGVFARTAVPSEVAATELAPNVTAVTGVGRTAGGAAQRELVRAQMYADAHWGPILRAGDANRALIHEVSGISTGAAKDMMGNIIARMIVEISRRPK